jgi:uncharacterized protein (TIGR03435 family)
MANRTDLAARGRAVRDDGQARGRAGRRTIAVACAGVAGLAAAIAPLHLVAQEAKTRAPAEVRRYEAATVKPCNAESDPNAGRGRGTAGGTNATASPGRMYVPCVSVEQLIYLAYVGYGAQPEERLLADGGGGPSDATKIRGGPGWVHSMSNGYSIEAVAPGISDSKMLLGPMLRILLEDRFKLRIHRDSEEVPMFALRIARSGFKLKPMKEGECSADRTGPPDPNATIWPCRSLRFGTNGANAVWTFNGFELSTLAARLSRALGRHVLDETGIDAEFVFRLEFHPDDATPGLNWTERDADDSVPRAASIFTALEQQLGLKIEPTRGRRGFIVIDHVERPTPQ